MATVNKRIIQPQALTINGISAGGLVTHQIQCGYDDKNQHPVDGAALATTEYLTEFVRGQYTTEDWVHFIELLTGTVGTDIFYQRKSGEAEATGYIKHTLTKPVIYKAELIINHRKMAQCTGFYECKAGDENDGIADMWDMTDSMAAPTHLSADRGQEILACQHSSTSIYHVTQLRLAIEMILYKASHDGDVGYTAVDALETGMRAYGSINFQDASIASSQIKAVQLVTADRASLTSSIYQCAGGADKTLTIAGVKFTDANHSTNAPQHGGNSNYDEFTANFEIVNSSSSDLTLEGSSKIVTIS